LEASGLTEDQVKLPKSGKVAETPQAVVATHKANWPVKASSSMAFDKLLADEGLI
jgi:coatomer protein complex subunit alpha (xenin)